MQTVSGQRATLRRREGARGRRKRRLRAEARIRLQLCRDAVRVPTLDGPVPLMVEQLVDVLQLLDALIPVAEQVIDVPKIFVERIPSRTSVREPQLAEQLVEVPTLISYSSFREIVEQNVDIQFLMVVMVFSVYTQDRVLQRLVEQIIVQ